MNLRVAQDAIILIDRSFVIPYLRLAGAFLLFADKEPAHTCRRVELLVVDLVHRCSYPCLNFFC